MWVVVRYMGDGEVGGDEVVVMVLWCKVVEYNSVHRTKSRERNHMNSISKLTPGL